MADGPVPNQVVVWRPGEFVGERSDDDAWTATNCLSTTKAGDRAVIYQSGPDGAIVQIFDFADHARPHRDLRFVGWGTTFPTPRRVPRDELLADPRLAQVFSVLRGRRSLPPDAAIALGELLGGWPDRREPAGPRPEMIEEDWAWIPAGDLPTWGSERALQQDIASTPDAWRRLGFPSRPELERSPPGTRDRIDLYAPGIIAEVKLNGDTGALRQLDEKYLKPLRERALDATPTGRWHGLILVTDKWSRQLAEQVAQRPDVQLIACVRQEEGIELTEIRSGDDAPFRLVGPVEYLSVAAASVDGIEGSIVELASLAGLDGGELDAAWGREQDDVGSNDASAAVTDGRWLVSDLATLLAAMAVLAGGDGEAAAEALALETAPIVASEDGAPTAEELFTDAYETALAIVGCVCALAGFAGMSEADIEQTFDPDAELPLPPGVSSWEEIDSLEADEYDALARKPFALAGAKTAIESAIGDIEVLATMLGLSEESMDRLRRESDEALE